MSVLYIKRLYLLSVISTTRAHLSASNYVKSCQHGWPSMDSMPSSAAWMLTSCQNVDPKRRTLVQQLLHQGRCLTDGAFQQLAHFSAMLVASDVCRQALAWPPKSKLHNLHSTLSTRFYESTSLNSRSPFKKKTTAVIIAKPIIEKLLTYKVSWLQVAMIDTSARGVTSAFAKPRLLTSFGPAPLAGNLWIFTASWRDTTWTQVRALSWVLGCWPCLVSCQPQPISKPTPDHRASTKEVVSEMVPVMAALASSTKYAMNLQLNLVTVDAKNCICTTLCVKLGIKMARNSKNLSRTWGRLLRKHRAQLRENAEGRYHLRHENALSELLGTTRRAWYHAKRCNIPINMHNSYNCRKIWYKTSLITHQHLTMEVTQTHTLDFCGIL